LDTLQGLLYGFSVALQPNNIFLVFVGCVLGTLVGVLPGIGPVAAISILLPLTFQLTPAGSIIMLAGIYYGVMYGGSTTSILVNVPGETASVVTCLDGYQMARQGRAGSALGIAAFGSFIAGTIGLIGLQFIAEPLSAVALKFGPPEYFALILLGFMFISYLSHGSMLKAGLMAFLGLILSSVGFDPITAQQRMTFGVLNLYEGLGVAPLAMGLFGVAEVFNSLEKTISTKILKVKIKNLFPNKLDWLQSKWAILRGTLIGFFLGILPGGGPVLSTFIAYGVEKRVAANPERFGKGAIEGVASPEAANNAATSTSFIPLLTLGIPPNVVLAVLYGAFLIHGVVPGPLLIQEHPDVFWGLLGSMYIGNVMLLILNLPLIPLWVQVLRIPDRVLYPGYLFKKFGYEAAPLILCFVLGPMFEVNLRRSLLISQGSFSIFFTRPIALTAIVVCVVLLLFNIYQTFAGKSRPAVVSD
jgi:putative tricarboxylic transport membrane protein